MTDDLAKTTAKWLEYIVVKEEDPIPEYFDSTPDPLGENSLKPIAAKQEGDLAVDTDLCKHEISTELGCSLIHKEEWVADIEVEELQIKDEKTENSIHSAEHSMRIIYVGDTKLQVFELPQSTQVEMEMGALSSKNNIEINLNSCNQIKMENSSHNIVGNTDTRVNEPRNLTKLPKNPSLVVPKTFLSENSMETDPLSFDQHDVTAYPGSCAPVSNHILVPQPPENQYKLYSCHQCGFKTRYSSNLNTHQKVHTADRPYACTHCDFRTKTAKRLKNHLMDHTKKKIHACGTCHFKCRSKNVLAKHTKVHEREVPTREKFTCDSCDFRCSRDATLIEHKIIQHSLMNPFSCSVCDYTCGSRKYLAFHMRLHGIFKTLPLKLPLQLPRE